MIDPRLERAASELETEPAAGACACFIYGAGRTGPAVAPPRGSGMKTSELIYKGSIIGAMITAPSLAAFAIVWSIGADLAVAAGAGAAAHVAALFVSFKFAGRILARRQSSGG